ncbi:hypothetical protein ACFY2N_27670 [Streptomyces rubiginosohelvolus]|uniref:hypothetical protein n=1 Tax=Streptomyces rubiginosohelvolus TaxID=67362 RepID=UPI0036A767D6
MVSEASSTIFTIRAITESDGDEKAFGPVTLALPDLATLRPVAVAITVIAALLIFKIRWSVLRTLGICTALGLGAALAGLPGI